MQQTIPRIIEFAVEYQNRYWEIILEHDSVQLPSFLSVTYSPAGCPDLKGSIRIESRLEPDKNYRWYQSMLLAEEIALQKDFLDKIGNAIEQKIFERSRPSTTTYINRSENSNYNASQDRLSIPFYTTGKSG